MVEKLRKIAKQIIDSSKKHNLTISFAESCTGGLLSSIITDIPGSSSVFLGGVIVYSNQLKTRILDVSLKSLDSAGAVSAEVAKEMASGLKKITKSDIVISITGIAGPTGGTRDKPVGTVFIALNTTDTIFVERFSFKGSRSEIKHKVTEKSLELIESYLVEMSKSKKDSIK